MKNLYLRYRFGYTKKIIFVIGSIVISLAIWTYIRQVALIEPVQTNRVDSEAKIEPIATLEFEQEEINELQNIIDTYIATQTADFSIYVEDLVTGETASHKANNPMITASLYKAFVANEAFKLVDEGELSLKQIVDKKRDLDLQKCLDIMITVSDNKCGVELQKLTGALNYLPQLKTQGYVNTDLRGYYPTSTASDVAQLYKNIYNENYLSSKSNSAFLKLLSDQEINDRIPAGLPDKTVIAHKTGDLSGAIHDGGIVYTENGAYVVVIMTQDWDISDQQAYNEIAKLAKLIHSNITE